MRLTGILPRPVKNWLQRPLSGMHSGSGVLVGRPHRISNPKYIHVGDRTVIHSGAMIAPITNYAGRQYTPRIDIGSDVYIGPDLYLACISRVEIGDGTVLSEGVFINDSNHGFDPRAGLIMEQPLQHGGEVIIGKSCFLGFRAAIMPGVELGDHCVVGIHSVVTRSFPAYCMLAGSPARIVKRFNVETGQWLSVSSQAHDHDQSLLVRTKRGGEE